MSAPQPAVTARNERINRRLHERVPIDSQVRLRWQDRQGNHVLRARAMDLSDFGMLVEAERAIEPGTVVAVEPRGRAAIPAFWHTACFWGALHLVPRTPRGTETGALPLRPRDLTPWRRNGCFQPRYRQPGPFASPAARRGLTAALQPIKHCRRRFQAIISTSC